MNRTTFFRIVFFLLVSFSCLQGQDATLTARMKERLPKVDALLEQGLAGESNEGYLVSRSKLNSEQQKILQEENQDRAIVYQMIAQKTGQPVAIVASQRAEQIRNRAVKGVWLQKPDGTWYQK